MYRLIKWLLPFLIVMPINAHAIVLSETNSGSDSTYQRQIQVDLTDHTKGAEYIVWLKSINGVYEHNITTTSQMFTVDVDSSIVYYVKVQERIRTYSGGVPRLTTTPFDTAPEASIKIFGNEYEFFNLRVANNIIYPSTVPIFKDITFTASGDTIFWSSGTLMFDNNVYNIVSGNSAGNPYAYWPGSDSMHFGSSYSQPTLSVWTVAGMDSATSDLYITESHKQIWGEVIRAGTITANQIAAGTITADRLAVAVWEAVADSADSGSVSWGNINGVPAEIAGSVSATGVYILPDYIGFYDDGTSSWPIRINNDSGTGKFFAGAADTSSYINWDGTNMTLKGGLITGVSGHNIAINPDGAYGGYLYLRDDATDLIRIGPNTSTADEPGIEFAVGEGLHLSFGPYHLVPAPSYRLDITEDGISMIDTSYTGTVTISGLTGNAYFSGDISTDSDITAAATVSSDSLSVTNQINIPSGISGGATMEKKVFYDKYGVPWEIEITNGVVTFAEQWTEP